MAPEHINEGIENSSRSKATVRVFIGGIAALILLQLVVSIRPSVHTFGVDYWSEIPLWVRVGLAIASLVMLIPRVGITIAGEIDRLSRVRGIGLIGLGLALVAFVAFRSQGFAYGDGYSYRAFLLDDQYPHLAGNLALMGGDLLVRWTIYHYLVHPLGGSLDAAIGITGALAGLLSGMACVSSARRLWPTETWNRRFAVAAVLSSGSIALWFGHAEAYSLVGAAILWSLALAIRSPGKARALVAAWLVALLGIFLHTLAVVLIPPLLWITLRHRVRPHFFDFTRRRAWVVLAGAVLVCQVLATVFNRFKPGILVPLAPGPESSYTVVSIAHLLDIANLLLFCAPLGVVCLLVCSVPRRSVDADIAVSGDSRFAFEVIAVTATSFIFFAFWVDPLLGAFRDWDLLSAFGIPLSLVAAAVMLRRLPAGGVASATVAMMIFAVGHAGVFVWTATQEPAVMLRVDRMVREDVHYSERFHHGERRTSWADILSRTHDRYDLARDHMLARVAYEPGDASAWRNLGVDYWHLDRVDSAAWAYRKSAELAPDRTSTWRELAKICLKQGDLPGVCDAYRQILAREDTSYSDRIILASACTRLKRYDEAIPPLEKDVAESPSRFEAHFMLGIIAEEKGDYREAVRRYEAAVRCGSTLPELNQRLTRCREAVAKGP
jgi:hypothetical protein